MITKRSLIGWLIGQIGWWDGRSTALDRRSYFTTLTATLREMDARGWSGRDRAVYSREYTRGWMSVDRTVRS